MSVESLHGDSPPELIQPLGTQAEAWQAIPGVSHWVLGIIKRGYSLQFARSLLTTGCSPQFAHHRVRKACVKALPPWKDPQWFKQGLTMGLIHRRKVVSPDASNTGRGALCEGRPTFSSWSDAEDRLHINYLEMMAVCWVLQTFLPHLKGHHVLVRSDSITVVS